jgi:MraZ protein
MDRFLSNVTNRVDAKGRVSIPGAFRAVLARDGFEGLFIHPALDTPALDAGGNALLTEIDSLLSAMPPVSEARDQLSTALYGVSEVLKVDPEGRVQLSESLKAYAGIGEAVTFVGLGHKFQLWQPERFRAHLEGGRERLRELRRTLQGQGPAFKTDAAR